jgi:hypothetical protein
MEHVYINIDTSVTRETLYSRRYEIFLGISGVACISTLLFYLVEFIIACTKNPYL